MTQKILRICFYLLFLVTPLLFTSWNSELFEYNKMMFVYALTIIIAGVWFIKMVSLQKLVFKSTPLNIPLGLFLLSQILSTIFSIDTHTSIWGYYSRSNGGLLSIMSYLLLYWAFVSNFNKEDVTRFLKFTLFGGLLVSLYAIPEHFGVSPSCVILTQEFTATCWIQDVQARVFATLGQPNWLAAYLAMIIFPAIYFFLTSKSTLSKSYYLLLITCYYLAFTFTYSRGATLGLIAGFAVLGLAFGFQFLKQKKATVSSWKPLAVIILTFIVVNLFFGSALSSFKLLQEPAVPARPGITQTSGTQLENGGTESGQIRLIVWKGALEIFKHYPILGSGVETFAYSYYQFRPLEHNNVSEWDFLYNKAHNEYLNYLATTGIFGIVTYLAIILIFMVWSIKYYVLSIKQQKSPNTYYLILTTSLLAGYISYLVQNFFLFSVVIVAVLFYLYPAFTFVYLEVTKDLSAKNPLFKFFNKVFELVGKKTIPRRVVQTLIVLIILVSLNSLFSLWEADTVYKKGTDYNDAGNPGRAYNYLIEAVRLNSKEPLYLSELGHSAASSALALVEEDATTSAQLKDDAIFFTDLALSISPVNTTVQRTAIRTFFELTLLDPSLESKTVEVIDKAIALSPTDPKLLHNKGIILAQFERLKEATASLQQAIKMKPNYRDGRLTLADLYIKNGQKDLAQAELDAVLKQIPGDPDALKLMEQIK